MDNIIGEKFNRLTVCSFCRVENKRAYWECSCDCGRKVIVAAGHLKSGHTKSCGCYKKDIFLKKIIDLTGKKFNYLLVLSYNGKKRRHEWKCRCDCGKEVVVTGNSLQSGNTKSCGCFLSKKLQFVLFNNLIGKRFGRLVVEKFSNRIKKHIIWDCICDCGNACKVRGNSMQSGNTLSCGCLKEIVMVKHGYSRKVGSNRSAARKFLWTADPKRKIRHCVSNSIRKQLRGAKSGSILNYLPYSIDELKKHLESQFESWMNWDNYGGNMNDPRKTWHIDHIIPHSSFQYATMTDKAFIECWSLSNLRPLEKHENSSKGNKLNCQ